ncbi:MAG: sigma-70 family RNA polymerase sigma factor [Rikenellaceae bacterium]
MSTVKLSDQELIRAFVAGDEEAIGILIERYTSRIRSYLRLMLRDDARAEDILQDTLIKAITIVRDGRYNDQGRFLSWVLRIAHNMAIDHFRSTKSRPVTNEAEAGYDILGGVRHTESAAEDRIMHEETLAQVRDLVTLLPDDQQEVVRLRYYSNLSFNEIAEQTGVSINTALGRMRYALINMRKMVKERQLALV